MYVKETSWGCHMAQFYAFEKSPCNKKREEKREGKKEWGEGEVFSPATWLNSKTLREGEIKMVPRGPPFPSDDFPRVLAQYAPDVRRYGSLISWV